MRLPHILQALNMNKLCEFALDKSIGFSVNVICTKTEEFCCMVRYCSLEQRPVMSSNYYKYGCKIKQKYGDEMARKNKNKQETITIPEPISVVHGNILSETLYVIGKVNFTKNGKTSVQYSMNNHLYNIKVNGTYSGTVRIDYIDSLIEKNIVSITQM